MCHHEHVDERDGVWEAMKARREEHLDAETDDEADGDERTRPEDVDPTVVTDGGDDV